MSIDVNQDIRIRKIEDHTIYPFAKYLYLIRTDEENTHSRIGKIVEFIPKYLSYILLAEYREKCLVNEVRRKTFIGDCVHLMQTASFGHWTKLLHLLLSEYVELKGDERYASAVSEMTFTKMIAEDVWDSRQDIADLVESRRQLYDVIKERKPKYQLPKLNSPSISLITFIDMLVTYRNAFYGHGDIGNRYEYKQHNRILTNIIINLIEHIRVIYSYKLAFVEQAKYRNGQMNHDLYVSIGRNLDFEKYLYQDTEVVDPDQVYLCEEVAGEYGTRFVPRLSLYPIVLYTFDVKENNKNLFFLGEVSEEHVGYTAYPTNTLYEPQNPALIFQSLLQTEYNHIITKRKLVEGESISESQNALSVGNWHNINRTFDIIDPADNPQIWEKFDDIYYAYNAPFKLEKETNLQLLVNKHAQRYLNPNLRQAKYLFFTGDTKSPKDRERFDERLKNFRIFVENLYEKVPEVLEQKMEIYFVNDAVPNTTFFAGEKMGHDYGIMYFHNDLFMDGDMPKLAFLTKDEPIVQAFRKTFQDIQTRHNTVHYSVDEFVKHPNIRQQIYQDLSSNIMVRKKYSNRISEMAMLSVGKERKAAKDVLKLNVEAGSRTYNSLRQRIVELMSRPEVQQETDTIDYQRIKQQALAFAERTLGVPMDDYRVMLGDNPRTLIYNTLLAVEGDILLPTPSTSDFISVAKMIDDAVIRFPLPIFAGAGDDGDAGSAAKAASAAGSGVDGAGDGSGRLRPSDFEKIIGKAKEEGRNPTKLLLHCGLHQFWRHWTQREMLDFVHICQKYSLMLIVEEVHGGRGFQVGDAPLSLLEKYYPEGITIITDLSKHLTLGGYRLAVQYIPPGLSRVYDAISFFYHEEENVVSRSVEVASANYWSGTGVLSEELRLYGSIHELAQDYVRRHLLRPYGMDSFAIANPFTLYVSLDSFRDLLLAQGIKKSLDLAQDLLKTESLLTIPGSAVGMEQGRLVLCLKFNDFNGLEAITGLKALLADGRGAGDKADGVEGSGGTDEADGADRADRDEADTMALAPSSHLDTASVDEFIETYCEQTAMAVKSLKSYFDSLEIPAARDASLESAVAGK